MATTFARIADGVVFEIVTLPDGQTPQTNYHADFAAQFVPCADGGVQQGWIYQNGTFSAAPPPPPPPPPTLLYYLEFEALFTPAESDAIMGAAAGGNAALLRWLLRATGAVQIDLGNPETVAGVNALVSAGLLTSDRGVRILAGLAPIT